MYRLRRMTRTLAFSSVVATFLFLANCKPPDSAKKEEPGSPSTKVEETGGAGELVPLGDRTYRQTDCDCSDEQERTVDLDALLAGALAAEKAGELKKYVDEHLKEKPLCRKARQGQSVVWKTDANKGPEFQILKFVNAGDGKDQELFTNPFPSAKGRRVSSGRMKEDAPSPDKDGKCFVFKTYVRLYKNATEYIDIDPHVGTGCCR
jgi:hypothetical protein